jgi:hypothetical protein
LEFREGAIKLEDVYQTWRYAELFNAKYAILASLEEIPEEIKRLSRVTYPLLVVPPYQRLGIASFDTQSGAFADWFEQNPLEKV